MFGFGDHNILLIANVLWFMIINQRKGSDFYLIRFNYLFIYFCLNLKDFCSVHGITSNLKSKVVYFTD